MPTISELEAAARAAQERFAAERQRLVDAEQAAMRAIHHHAEVHARVVSGAGAKSDVTAAARARNEAIAHLEAVRAELQPPSP